MSILKEVKDWLDTEEDEKMALEQLQQHGCVSGMVPALINYYDTDLFYTRNQQEINNRLGELCESTGETPSSLLRDYDVTDPLNLNINNRNLLAWVGFEETALQYYMDNYDRE